MKKVKLWMLLLTLFCTITSRAAIRTVQVSSEEIRDGYYIEQIALILYAVPEIRISDTAYQPTASTLTGVKPADAQAFDFRLGMENNRSFGILRVPAYRKMPDGSLRRLSTFSIEILERTGETRNPATAAKTTAAGSPLGNGSWYKIAVPARGMYKVDVTVLKSLGISTGNLNSASIRLLGNGGAMLSENNSDSRPMQLLETAIWMNDGGDGKFDNADFFAFYAPGHVRWDKDSARSRFRHVNNLYADSSYYFLSVDAGSGLRVQGSNPQVAANRTVTAFNDYAAHERDLYNPGHFGKEWWGEKFGLGADAMQTREVAFSLGGVVDSLHYRISTASRSSSPDSRMGISLNGSALTNYGFTPVSSEEDTPPVSEVSSAGSIAFSSPAASFSLSYNGVPEAIGYLNYIELNWRRPLTFAGGFLCFRDWQSVGAGAVAEYQLNNASTSTQVWDVTDLQQPVRMNGTLSGDRFTFSQTADMLHEFVAFDGTSWNRPVAAGKVANQDLHSVQQPELVIVTHPAFLPAADRLAIHHRERDGLRVLVTTTAQVYNEFSSGGQDISAIRDMMRHLYKNAGQDSLLAPKYLLLFGDASYDYKNRIGSNSNYVPTFESADGVDAQNAYNVDDFFGFLDDNENISDFRIINTLDIGIGRLPVNNLQQANEAVDKIIAYTSPASLGPWRLSNMYMADNEDNAGFHPMDAEDVASAVNAKSPFSTDVKVYLDNLPFVATPSGARAPEANKAINDQIFNGTFLINYTGHGSIVTLASERILTQQDFNQWRNINKLPFMVTATCSYAKFDNPSYTSNGEALILKKDGGTIAMLTTTGLVYAGINRDINQQFLTEQYTKRNGRWPTFGDAIRAGKNITYKKSPGEFSLLNFYRFTLLGDPALQPAFPRDIVHTDSIVDLSSGKPADTIKALGRYAVSGHVSDDAGNELTTFNGRVNITIYDKARVIDIPTKVNAYRLKYNIRENIIFNGIASVENGRFTCSFIAPKDMIYDFGQARISYYAEDGKTDAAGLDTNLQSGGYFDGAVAENDAPIVRPFIGDTLFRDGGITGANTLLYVTLADSSGINVSGAGVGHDITAVLDGDEMRPFILNKLYQSEPNTYQRGHLSFPLTDLSEGLHTVTVKAWDVYNNSGSGTIGFRVADGKVVQIENLMNYPNPFSDRTRFIFDHNHPSEAIEVQIQIFNSAGSLVRTITETLSPRGSRTNEISWDGTSDSGAPIGGGVYPYRLTLRSAEGVVSASYQKLVIIR